MAREEELNPKLAYICKLYAPENEVLRKIHDSPAQQRQGIQLQSYEGKIIAMLLKMIGAKKVLEIGTLAGYSAAWIASALPQDGKLISLEKSAENAKLARDNLKHLSDKVEVLQGEAAMLLSELQDETFDVIFIDADKTGYPKYLDFAEQCLRKGGLVIADNTFIWGTIFEDEPPLKNPQIWHAMKEFNERLADQSKYSSVIIPTKEGLSVAIKEF